METAYSLLTLMPNSKAQVADFSNQLITSVKEGLVDPLKLKSQFKFIEKVIEKVDAEIKDEVITEAMRNGKKFEKFGFQIEVSENLATRYDYSNCNDVEWDRLNKQIAELTTLKKLREAWLRQTVFSLEIVDTETGETHTINPPIKSSTTGVKLTAI